MKEEGLDLREPGSERLGFHVVLPISERYEFSLSFWVRIGIST